jgi:hypothetical protein
VLFIDARSYFFTLTVSHRSDSYASSKYLLVTGLCIRLVGVGLMIHSRGANASDVELIFSQILQGIGGGFAAGASQVTAQASVTHADVAMVTAIVLLLTEIGGAIGSAIGTYRWAERSL